MYTPFQGGADSGSVCNQYRYDSSSLIEKKNRKV